MDAPTAERTISTSVLEGVGVGRAVVVGPVLRMPDPVAPPAADARTTDADGDVARAEQALRDVAGELSDRASRVSGAAREVLEAQAMFPIDPTLGADVTDRIRGGAAADRAVAESFAQFRDMLTAVGGYLGERAADLDDVAQRVIAQLRGVPAPGVPDADHPFVLVARDLAPADTALLDLDKVLGLITSEGGPTSHTAILARDRAIPAIVGVRGALDLSDGTEVVLDAGAGSIVVAPDDEARTAAEARAADLRAAAEAPLTPGATADGVRIPLLANLAKPAAATKAVELGAEGVGLFRTEFLYLDVADAPDVETQQAAYVELLSAFAGKKVVVRCLDAGADKPLAFLNDADEENPALGLRGLRALRANEHILLDQLTALANAQATTDADLWVMAPMVADAEETEYFVSIARRAGLRTVGVMAEVPSIGLVAEQVLQHADFISIGTNDLTQYTLAADRLLGTVAGYQDPWHPAVLRLVERIAQAGRAAGKPVGVCGEAAADPDLAVVLVGLGVTSLSMTPSAFADVRAQLAKYPLEQAEAKAAAALGATTAAAARAAATR